MAAKEREAHARMKQDHLTQFRRNLELVEDQKCL